MKYIVFLFAICALGTSCATGYGCPYSSVEEMNKPTTEHFNPALEAENCSSDHVAIP